MKKTTIAIAILSTSLAYADTTTTPAASNTATTAPAATTTQPAAPAKTAPAPKKPAASSQSSGSVYDSVKSGWNSFIDVLTGTKDPGK